MVLVKKKTRWEWVGYFDDEEERSRTHAGKYIFLANVAQIVINKSCKKKSFAAQNLGGGGHVPLAHPPKSVAV